MRLKRYNKKTKPICVTKCDEYYLKDITDINITSFPNDTYIRDLIKSYRESGDSKYLKTLTEIFSKYVVSIANSYQRSGLPLSDLISEGMLGLYAAIENFRLEGSTKFITYSNYVIARNIVDALDLNHNIVWLPKHIRVQNNKNNLKIRKLQQIDRFDSENIIERQNLASKLNSIAKLIYTSDLERSEADVFCKDSEAEKLFDKLSLEKDLKFIFSKLLTPIETNVIIYKFGLFGNPKIEFMETLATRLNISVEEAIRSYRKAFKLLSKNAAKNILIKYLDN